MLVTNLFPTPAEPERGVFTLHIARSLEQFCAVTVVCPLPWFPRISLLRSLRNWYRFAEVPSSYSWEGIRVLSPKYLLLPKVSEPMHAKLMALRLRPLLRKLAREGSYDVINSHWLFPDSVAVCLANLELGIPHVATGLGCDVNKDLYEPDKRGQILQALGQCDRITVVSQDLAEHLIGAGIPSSRIDTIPNGVDLERFKPRDGAVARKALGLKLDGGYLLYVGRLSEEKNVETLIDAFQRLGQQRGDTRLMIVGDGPLRSALENQAARLGIEALITFVGNIEYRAIPTWMNAADWLCLPSRREGCPNVVLEALASGLPVVASSVGAIPDMVGETAGILVEPNRSDRLAVALAAAINRSWSRVEIAETMASRSWLGVAKRYSEVYFAAIQGQDESTGQPQETAN